VIGITKSWVVAADLEVGDQGGCVGIIYIIEFLYNAFMPKYLICDRKIRIGITFAEFSNKIFMDSACSVSERCFRINF